MSVTAERVTVPLGDARDNEAMLVFDHGVDRMSLQASSSLGYLLEAKLGTPGPEVSWADGRIDVDYPYLGVLRRAHPAQVLVEAGVGWTIRIVGGAHDVLIDLTGSDLRELEITGGANGLTLILDEPEKPRGIIADELCEATIRRPADVPVLVEVHREARRLVVDGRRIWHGNGLVAQTPGYDPTDPGYLITVDIAVETRVERS
ncbi:hypothetical protein ACIBHX_03315 [Nonomuraea sp. NPDC050536]|uniref:hypothetical protein n=1 Tax=Nonomuraea sp. NPDC050536 TaxID=3364366 RepID=UPI0037CAE77D